MKNLPAWLHFLSDFPLSLPGSLEALVQNAGEDLVLWDSAQDAIHGLADTPVPFTLAPLGRMGGRVAALDCSVAAVEAGLPGLLLLREDGYWEPASGPANHSYREKGAFSELAKRLENARKDGSEDLEISLLAGLFRRPVYTANGASDVQNAMDRLLALHAARGAESLSFRLSESRLDAEKWRIIGAERAIAGRTRDALVALSGAHFLGASLEMIAFPAGQCLGHSGWKWGGQLLKFHKKRSS